MSGAGATVVVFGATSYVGGFLIRALLTAGHPVIGVTRRPRSARTLIPERMRMPLPPELRIGDGL